MGEPAVLPISLKPSNLRPLAYRVLSKKHGLNIQSSALERLSEYVGRRIGQEWRGPKTISFLEEVARLWKEQDKGLFLDGDNLEFIIREIAAKHDKQEGRVVSKTSASPVTSALESTVAEDGSSKASFEIHQDSEISEPLNATKYDDLTWRDFFKVIEVSNFKRFKYNHLRKQFDILSSGPNSSPSKLDLPSADDSTDYFIQKYHLLKDRLLRNESFQPSTFSSVTSISGKDQLKADQEQITSIKNLLGRHGNRFLLFGLLTKNYMGLWQLQDETDHIELELGQCIFPENSYFSPGNFVICDGIYSNSGKFYVSSVVHPPAEKRELTLDVLGNVDLNSVYSRTGRIDAGLKQKLLATEKENRNHKLIFLGGDLHLSDQKILEGLKKVFTRLTADIEKQLSDPISIVFSGSFTEHPFDATPISHSSQVTSSGTYKSYFDSLSSLLEHYPTLCSQCKFIFVPGDNDPWTSMVTKTSSPLWPKMKIPKVFGNRITRLLKDVEWCSNPCKLNYLTHDIVIVRDDLGARFRRNDISYVSSVDEDKDERGQSQATPELEIDRLSKPKLKPEVIESRKVVKTLLDQGNLSPFTLSVRPVLANYANILNLVPLPTLLVLVDTSSPGFDLIYENCHVLNPGKFHSNNKFTFLEYFPSTRKAKLIELY